MSKPKNNLKLWQEKYPKMTTQWSWFPPEKPEKCKKLQLLDKKIHYGSFNVFKIDKNLYSTISQKIQSNEDIEIHISTSCDYDYHNDVRDVQNVISIFSYNILSDPEYDKKVKQWEKDIEAYNQAYEFWKKAMKERKIAEKLDKEEQDRQLYEKLKQRFENKNDK